MTNGLLHISTHNSISNCNQNMDGNQKYCKFRISERKKESILGFPVLDFNDDF